MRGKVTNGFLPLTNGVYVLGKVHRLFCCTALIMNYRLNEEMEGQGSGVTQQGSRWPWGQDYSLEPCSGTLQVVSAAGGLG